MFPGADAQIYRNDEGEVLGWDYPSHGEPEYCDRCGMTHSITFDCEYQEDNDDAPRRVLEAVNEPCADGCGRLVRRVTRYDRGEPDTGKLYCTQCGMRRFMQTP